MPRLTDYAIITDEKFSLNTSGDIDRDFNFTLENGALLGVRSILAFVPSLKSGATTNLRIEVKVNGIQQLNSALSGAQGNTLHEVVNANVLKAGANNIKFRIANGTGAVEFGDVVLLYQRETA